jgi:hypothetical protein
MSMFRQFIVLLVTAALTLTAVADVKRTSSGKPDLSGVYDTGILTPTQRPEWLGEIESFYPWVANALNWAFGVASEWRSPMRVIRTAKPHRLVVTATTLAAPVEWAATIFFI